MAEDAVTENEESEEQESEETESEDLENEDGDSDADEQDEEAPKPALKSDGTPVSDDDWRKTRRQTKEANKEALRFRKRSEELEALVKELQAKGGTETDENERETIESAAYSKGQTETEAKFKTALAFSAAETALVKAGFKGDPSKYTKFIDLESIELDMDEKGRPSLTGVDDFVEDLQTDYPELFKTEEEERPKPRTRNVDTGDKRRPAETKKSSAELIQEELRKAMTG